MLVHPNKSATAFAAPWAYDAAGEKVATRFVADGNTLTQVVDHKQPGITYPVVADPHVARYWNGWVISLNRNEMLQVAYGGSQALIAMLLIPGVGWAMIAGVLAMSGYAMWAYHNRKCAWFWVSPDRPTWGWYDC